jgi:hypothetical protein
LDDVTLGAEPVARIARVEVPESIISGTDAPLAVTYSGDLRFPVRLIYRPRSCPPGYNCRTEEKAFTAAPDDARLVGERFVRCLTAGADPWAMDFEAVLKDSAGIEIARPAPVVCQPAR